MTQRSYAPEYEQAPRLLRDYPEYVEMGTSSELGGKVYLVRPSWDCDRYWWLGYLSRWNPRKHDIDFHTHFDSCIREIQAEKGTMDWHTATEKFLFDGGLVEPLHNSNNLWRFLEIMKTLYSLKETAEVLGRGGSHFTMNPCADIIRNHEEVKRINAVVIPALVDELYKLLGY